jgi:hypothetical protein
MKIGSEFVANISDSVLKTLEAEAAQNSMRAEQSTQLNSNKPTVVKKWSELTGETCHLPVGIIHYFSTSGHYIRSVMKLTLHKWCHTVYWKSNHQITEASYWIKTKKEPKIMKFNLMDPSTKGSCPEALWAKILESYKLLSPSFKYAEKCVRIQYLTDEVKSKPQSYAEPLF